MGNHSNGYIYKLTYKTNNIEKKIKKKIGAKVSKYDAEDIETIFKLEIKIHTDETRINEYKYVSSA